VQGVNRLVRSREFRKRCVALQRPVEPFNRVFGPQVVQKSVNAIAQTRVQFGHRRVNRVHGLAQFLSQRPPTGQAQTARRQTIGRVVVRLKNQQVFLDPGRQFEERRPARPCEGGTTRRVTQRAVARFLEMVGMVGQKVRTQQRRELGHGLVGVGQLRVDAREIRSTQREFVLAVSFPVAIDLQPI